MAQGSFGLKKGIKVEVPITRCLLALATLNLELITQFYTTVLNQEPRVFQSNLYAEYDLPGLRLGIFQTLGSRWPEFSQPRNSPLSVCLYFEDLEAAIMHLTQLGYAPPGQIQEASHGREVYAYDPDGNRLILYQPHI